MSLPAYLDSTVYPFSYTELNGLTDVETGGVGVITSMRAMLVGGTLNWTEPSTALFKTPVDGAGRFLDILVTRITSTTIEWRVRNQAGTTVCTRRVQLGTGGLRIYGTNAGCCIEFLQTSQNSLHVATGFLLDMNPDLTSDHTLYVIGNGFLNTGNSNDSAGDQAGEFFAIDNGSAASVNRTNYLQDTTGNVPNFISAGGKFFFREFPLTINFAGTFRWAGRIPQCIQCDPGMNGGDERKVYIDTSTVATFKVIGQNVVSPRMALRKS